MITCKRTNNSFSIEGLTVADMEVIQDGIIRLFNESHRAEHSNFRNQVLRINRPIDDELEKLKY